MQYKNIMTDKHNLNKQEYNSLRNSRMVYIQQINSQIRKNIQSSIQSPAFFAHLKERIKKQYGHSDNSQMPSIDLHKNNLSLKHSLNGQQHFNIEGNEISFDQKQQKISFLVPLVSPSQSISEPPAELYQKLKNQLENQSNKYVTVVGRSLNSPVSQNPNITNQDLYVEDSFRQSPILKPRSKLKSKSIVTHTSSKKSTYTPENHIQKSKLAKLNVLTNLLPHKSEQILQNKFIFNCNTTPHLQRNKTESGADQTSIIYNMIHTKSMDQSQKTKSFISSYSSFQINGKKEKLEQRSQEKEGNILQESDELLAYSQKSKQLKRQLFSKTKQENPSFTKQTTKQDNNSNRKKSDQVLIGEDITQKDTTLEVEISDTKNNTTNSQSEKKSEVFSNKIFKEEIRKLNEDIKNIQNNYRKVKDLFLSCVYKDAEVILASMEEFNLSNTINVKNFASFLIDTVTMIVYPKHPYNSIADIQLSISSNLEAPPYQISLETIEQLAGYLYQSLASVCIYNISALQLVDQFQIICKKSMLGQCLISQISESQMNNILNNVLIILSELPSALSLEEVEAKYPLIQEILQAIIKEDYSKISAILKLNNVVITQQQFFFVKLSLMKVLSKEESLHLRLRTKIVKRLEKIRCLLFPNSLLFSTDVQQRFKDNLFKNPKYKLFYQQSGMVQRKSTNLANELANTVLGGLQGNISLLRLHIYLKRHTNNEFPEKSQECINIFKETIYETVTKANDTNVVYQLKDLEFKLYLMANIYELQVLDQAFIKVEELIHYFKKWVEEKLNIYLQNETKSAIQFNQQYFDFFEFLIFSISSKEEIFSMYDIIAAKQYFDIEHDLFKIFLNELAFFLLKYNFSKSNIKLLIKYLQKCSLLI